MTSNNPASSNDGIPIERQALEAFFHATGGRGWRREYNWLSDKPLGEWYGVSTDGGGRVTRLSIDNNWLRGEIPPELGNLSNLEDLRLDANQLSGEIPPELSNLSNLGKYEAFV